MDSLRLKQSQTALNSSRRQTADEVSESRASRLATIMEGPSQISNGVDVR